MELKSMNVYCYKLKEEINIKFNNKDIIVENILYEDGIIDTKILYEYECKCGETHEIKLYPIK